MEGLGNAYLYVYADRDPRDPAALSRRLSDRHFGAGSDGMIWILPSDQADFRMRIFNADGSEALMCGNGIRCVGKYVFDKGLTDKTDLTIETLSGIRHLSLCVTEGRVTSARVDMGKTAVSAPLVLEAAGQSVTVYPVSVGNPHAVLFCDPDTPIQQDTLTAVGRALEHHPAFPDGVNVEFVQVLSPARLRMRVWERGSGITMACGTGACAAAAAAEACGYCPPDGDVTVALDGGELTIRISPDHTAFMTGPAKIVYEGETADEYTQTAPGVTGGTV